MVSARTADEMGFKALYMSGYAVTASYMGLPDAGIATYRDMVERAGTIAGGTVTPLIADADTGYGGLVNLRHTVRGYEAAGVQAIQIEDQVAPKKCGHTLGRQVVPASEMAQKVKVAIDSRRHDQTLIIARTDARTEHGLDAAIDRAGAYLEAGAQIAFVESPESGAEMERIGKELDGHLLANMVEGGRTPLLPADRLQQLGFNIAIYPLLGLSAAAWASRQAYQFLLEKGTSEGVNVPLRGVESLHELMGFPEIWEFEKRWGED